MPVEPNIYVPAVAKCLFVEETHCSHMWRDITNDCVNKNEGLKEEYYSMEQDLFSWIWLFMRAKNEKACMWK